MSKIIIYIFILSILINFCNGAITIRAIEQSNSENPFSTNENYCKFTFDYLMISDDAQSFPILSSYPVSSDVTIVPLIKNSSSSITRVYFNVPIGGSSFMFHMTSGVTSIPHNVVLKCIEFETISITTLYKPNSISNRGLYKNSGVVKIVGGAPITEITTSLSPTQFIYNRDNIFTISNLYFPIEINYQSEILFYSRPSIIVSLNSYFIQTTNSIILNSISVYPNRPDGSVIEYVEMGLGYFPLISFKDNSSVSNPYYSIGNSINSNSVLPKPVYSINGETTYIGNFNAYTNGPGTRFTLYSQVNKDVIDVFSYGVVINKMITSQYEPSFTVQIDTTSDPDMQVYWLTLTGKSKYDFSSFTNSYIGSTHQFTFPYGFSGTNSQYLVSSQIFIKTIGQLVETTFDVKPTSSIISYTKYLKPTTAIPSNIISPPQLITYSYKYLYEFKYLISLNISSGGVASIKIGNGLQFGMESYSSGTLVQALFEMVYDAALYDFSKITITDIYGSSNQYDVDSSYYSINPPLKVTSPPYVKSLDIDSFSISDVSYQLNNIDVTNQSVVNIVYFNISNNEFPNRPIGLLLTNRIALPLNDGNQDYYYAVWDTVLKQYKIEFIIPKNSRPGVFPYLLVFGYDNYISSSNLPDNQQLILKCLNYDGYGPVFTSITNTFVNFELQWLFTIQDLINGFSHGDFIVRGSTDNSIHHAHIDSSQVLTGGDIWTGNYIIKFRMPSKCVSQNYTITDVTLYDTMNIKSIFSMNSQVEVDPIVNPFINFLDDPFINTLPVYCVIPLVDSAKPTLVNFTGSFIDGVAAFSFEATSLTGIYDIQLPIVYLQSYNMKTIECISRLIESTSTNSKFECSVSLERGFGSQGFMTVSVYGIINNGGYYNGFSSYQLGAYQFTNIFQISTFIERIKITGTSKVTTNSGEIWINGIGFEADSMVYIKNFGDTTFTAISTLVNTTRTLRISNIKITNKPITIKVIKLFHGMESNEYIITPLNFNIAPNVDPPVITNAPQTCLGNPQCGGSNQGYCSSSGCICYSPWISNDCLSKVIIIPQPQTNTTNPSTEIPITEDPNTSNFLYKSLISLVSIREFDFNSIQVNQYQFDKWIHNQVNSTTSEYFTNITVPSTDGVEVPTTTTIKATLQWYKDLTNITFANEQLTMNPSSIKYTIELSSYKFKSNLNTLQLIMSASLSSIETNGICSLKEFGETSSGDNSNYIKVQIQDHSLYGRFIRRAIIDNQIKSIDNTPLDSSFNAINIASSSQSFIGINIPSFKSSLIIDPDFSILLNNNHASDNNNSICSSPSSGLTNSQLAGIIVGAGVIFLSIVGAGIYILIKKRKHTLLLLGVKEIVMRKKN